MSLPLASLPDPPSATRPWPGRAVSAPLETGGAVGSGEGVRGTGGISAALGTRLPSLAHRLLTRSLSPSLCAVCPPACLLPAAGCLLALSLALPAFAAHAGSYVTANRPDSGKEVHVPRAAALGFGSGHSGRVHSSRVPVPGKGELRGRVAKAGLLRTESRRDSGAV